MEAVAVESNRVNINGNTLQFLLECKKNGEDLSKQALPSIYMVPSLVRDLSPSSYTPRVVAIGPLHRQDKHLQGFEVQKTTYLHNMFHRFGRINDKQTLRKCVEKVSCSIEKIKACYAVSTTYGDFELANMMVLDACFILEFIQSLYDGVPPRTNMLITQSIIYDLLLIENQIPFFVLENIFDCTILASGKWSSLTMFLRKFVEYRYVFEDNVVVPRAHTPDHILGFLHKYHQPTTPMKQASKSSRKRHSAMELDRAGMNFKPYTEDKNWALAMKLEFPRFLGVRRPTLMMPKAYINDASELILRNLVVYEQSSDGERYVTAYLMAMDMLIDTPGDVALLEKSKVISHGFGTDEEAADMLNKLCKNILFPDFFYDQQWEEMDTYYKRKLPHTIAVLKRKYFSNPWSIIALIAAIILFGLTVVQTIFTIKSV